ncbi:STELAR K+ outward rectifier [Actinidia rufa]|uniref:STELAR K+ outward rectifier n=1 Tax=Actinidia rufa TaxID=165716 RepID=A0A7J0EMC2_9ERIC|nr:STELAR K+ outward rectifier [Actinidia rufa]
MQVVSGMDEDHIGMGSVLVFLHAHGVWVFQGIAEETLLIGHRWPSRFPCRHHPTILRRLQRQPDLQNHPQAHHNCSSVPEIEFCP